MKPVWERAGAKSSVRQRPELIRLLLGGAVAVSCGVLADFVPYAYPGHDWVAYLAIVQLGLAPLPAVAIARPTGLGNALKLGTALQALVTVAYATTWSVMHKYTFVDFFAFLPLPVLFGYGQFAVISIPAIAMFGRAFHK